MKLCSEFIRGLVQRCYKNNHTETKWINFVLRHKRLNKMYFSGGKKSGSCSHCTLRFIVFTVVFILSTDEKEMELVITRSFAVRHRRAPRVTESEGFKLLDISQRNKYNKDVKTREMVS